jgi:hypothetical protein
MKFTKTSLVLAGLMALGGVAQAQTSNVPLKAGEASTVTNGAPNAQTTNTPGTEGVVTKESARQDAQGRSKASATTNSPGRAGEASTMVKGNPNADPDSPLINKSKAERRTEKEMKKAQRKHDREIAGMGQKGAQVGAEAGTPQVSPAGNPSVFKGGTPK